MKLQIKFGTMYFNNYLITDIYKYQQLLLKFKNKTISQKFIYNKYYDHNNIYKIYDNGIEEFYKYLKKNKNEIRDNDNIFILEDIEYEKLYFFDPKYSFDKIKYIKSTIFFFHNYSIEFMNVTINDYHFNQIIIYLDNIEYLNEIKNLFI